MKLFAGPMIVTVSINCSTAKTAARIPSHRGNWPSLAANRIGTATMMSATVRIGPHIVAMSVTVRAVADPNWSGCSDSPATNHIAMATSTSTTAEPMVNPYAQGPANRSRAYPNTTTNAKDPNVTNNACTRIAPECPLTYETMS